MTQLEAICLVSLTSLHCMGCWKEHRFSDGAWVNQCFLSGIATEGQDAKRALDLGKQITD